VLVSQLVKHLFEVVESSVLPHLVLQAQIYTNKRLVVKDKEINLQFFDLTGGLKTSMEANCIYGLY